jgi:alkaline phosphatase D
MIHLGDYIYDYVDDEEQVRVPDPFPKRPASLQDYRERHKYYLAEPDLRYARQQQTWIAIWDNHDILNDDPKLIDVAKQAFFEYLPIREQDPAEPYRIYRSFKMGNLADLMMLDEDSYVSNTPNDTSTHTFLGHAQRNWLYQQLGSSKGKWRIIGSQKMMGSWYSKGLPGSSKLPGNGTYFDPNDWDGFPEERGNIYDFLKDNKINNNIVVSGDLHMSFAINLTKDPFNRKIYKRSTGKGAVGVEFLPSSISRGNFDEQGVPVSVIPTAQTLSKRANPHHVYCEFMQHGYGILDITPERSIAEFWYVRKDIITNKQTFAVGLKVKDGENHWEWQMLAYPTK